MGTIPCHLCQTVLYSVLIKSTVKLKVKYQDGEEEVIDMNKVEPENAEFDSPKEGDEVCCRVSGARYSATVLGSVGRVMWQRCGSTGSTTPGTKKV